jgi:hypothetical protein
MAQRADGYQATTGFTLDSTLVDFTATNVFNSSTGYLTNVGTPDPAVTLLVDIGPSPTTVYKVRVGVMWTGAYDDPLIEYSSDGVTWSTAAHSGFIGYTSLWNGCSISFGGTANRRQETLSLTTPTAAQYWRVSVQGHNYDGTHTCVSGGGLGIFGVGAWDVSDVYITESVVDNPPFSNPERTAKYRLLSIFQPPPPNPFVGGRQPLEPRKLPVVVIAVPPTPVNTNPSSLPVRMILHQDVPGTVLIVNSATSSPVRMVFTGGGGSETNGANLFTSSRPVRMSLTSAAATGTTILQTGNLKFSMCRDNRGANWTTEQSIATGVDYSSSGVAWLGNRWGCLYTVSGQAYWKTTANPEDWSAGPSTVTGITGRVYGLACNQMGVLCALVDKKPVVSRNGGLTWTAGAALTLNLPASICAKDHYFVIASPIGTTVTHFVSKDGGLTFR